MTFCVIFYRFLCENYIVQPINGWKRCRHICWLEEDIQFFLFFFFIFFFCIFLLITFKRKTTKLLLLFFVLRGKGQVFFFLILWCTVCRLASDALDPLQTSHQIVVAAAVSAASAGRYDFDMDKSQILSVPLLVFAVRKCFSWQTQGMTFFFFSSFFFLTMSFSHHVGLLQTCKTMVRICLFLMELFHQPHQKVVFTLVQSFHLSSFSVCHVFLCVTRSLVLFSSFWPCLVVGVSFCDLRLRAQTETLRFNFSFRTSTRIFKKFQCFDLAFPGLFLVSFKRPGQTSSKCPNFLQSPAGAEKINDDFMKDGVCPWSRRFAGTVD